LQEAQVRRERSRARQAERFLTSASASLADMIDYEGALSRVASLCVPELADLSVVVVDEGERLCQVTAGPSAGNGGTPSAELRRFCARAAEREGPVGAMRSGEVERLDVAPPALLARLASSREHLATLRRLGPWSCEFLPLRTRA